MPMRLSALGLLLGLVGTPSAAGVEMLTSAETTLAAVRAQFNGIVGALPLDGLPAAAPGRNRNTARSRSRAMRAAMLCWRGLRFSRPLANAGKTG